MSSILRNLLRLALWLNVCAIVVNVSYTLENSVYLTMLGEMSNDSCVILAINAARISCVLANCFAYSISYREK